MAPKQSKQKNVAPEKGQEKLPAKPAVPKPALAMTRHGFAPTTMEEAWRFATALAESDMVPDRYRDKPRDCLVVLDLSARLGSSWLAVMQHVYSVHGRIGMESALVTALVNQSGMFADPIEYEVKGDDASKPDYKVRAHATRKSTGTVLYGPWIDWKLVRAEKWDSKDGSKWRSMPEQMFHYRAAAWFQRRHCPEVTMGMLTTDEAADIGPKQVDSTVIESGVSALKDRLAEREKAQSGGNGNGEDEAVIDQQIEDEIVETDEPEPVGSELRSPETNEKIEQEKEKLQTTGTKSNLF